MNFRCHFQPLAGLLLTVLASCSGRSGDGLPDYSGTWNASVALKTNTCPGSAPEQFTSLVEQHSIGQDREQISLTNGLENFSGNLLNPAKGHTSFFANGPARPLPGFLSGYTCEETVVWQYEDIKANSSSSIASSVVTRSSSISCKRDFGNSAVSCAISYVGNSTRT